MMHLHMMLNTYWTPRMSSLVATTRYTTRALLPYSSTCLDIPHGNVLFHMRDAHIQMYSMREVHKAAKAGACLAEI